MNGILGLITEYNPFHNGHKYLIDKAKDLTDADKIIVAKKLKRKKKDVVKLAFTMLAVILMMYPSFVMGYYVLGSEFTGAEHNAEEIGSYGNIKNANHTWNVTHNYISNDYRETFFFKYLAKK